VDADISLEVTAPSLGGGRRERIQEEAKLEKCTDVTWVLRRCKN